MKEVIIRFLYEEEKGKDKEHYQDKAFEDIYYSCDLLQAENFEVRDYKRKTKIN